jgi:putative Mg2+ transporter-C (MgtC) family protein
MWDGVLETVQQEFSDVPNSNELTRLLLRLGLAMALGAAIGYERESRDSSAGLRTHMLVALGTALFVLVPLQAGMDSEGMSRVIQGLLAGIGFLGAGAVIKQSDSGQVRGLTTAAGIWTTAAIGMTVGLGRETTAIISTVLVLIILSLLLRLERRIVRAKEARGEVNREERQARERDS